MIVKKIKTKKIKFSLIQIEGKESPYKNAILIKKNLEKTKKFNPDIICLPECSNIITANKSHLFNFATTQKNCPVLSECAKYAKKNHKYISIGSLLLKNKNKKKLLNRSFFINKNGKIVAYYDKIHLFDVNINKNEIHKESKSFYKGSKLIYANTPWGKIGLTICYDIRFPSLYRKLIKKGVKIILVPAAFTVPTGKDHWEVLLRSRAIENTSFIIATGQCGKHHGGRKTYGHSMIVDPWGKIVSKAFSKSKILNSTINIDQVNLVRNVMPSIKHG